MDSITKMLTPCMTAVKKKKVNVMLGIIRKGTEKIAHCGALMKIYGMQKFCIQLLS